MKREIKFRGKSVYGTWHYGDYFSLGYSNKIVTSLYNEITESHDFEYHDIIPETVGQFTDLKDKHGVDIYEGDLIKMIDEWYDGDILTKGYLGIVVFDDGMYCIRKKINDDITNWMPLDESSVLNYEYEIVGNIHD